MFSSAANRPKVRTLAITVLAAATFLGGTRASMAQEAPEPKPHWEFVVNTGVLIPTAVQRDLTRSANLTAAQLTYVVRPDLAVTTVVGWARGRDRATAGEPKLDILTYDVGAELRPARWAVGKAITLSPFMGIGAGGRSYRYRSGDVNAANNLSAYVSGGGEIGVRRVRLRLELRDYVTGFKPLSGVGASSSRNDVVAMIGLRYIKRLP
jgi:hypothetical protein